MEIHITLDKLPFLINEAVKQFEEQQQKLIEAGEKETAQPISVWLTEFATFITPKTE